LATFEPRIPLRRTHQPHAATFEFVADPGDQRRFRSHYGEVRLEPLGQGKQCAHVLGSDGPTFGFVLDPAIARRAPDLLNFRRLPQPPDHRVLASAAANHQDFHSSATIDVGPATVNPDANGGDSVSEMGNFTGLGSALACTHRISCFGWKHYR